MVFNCETFPVLKTQRLTLRELKLDDADGPTCIAF